jgi:hypothetical protein
MARKKELDNQNAQEADMNDVNSFLEGTAIESYLGDDEDDEDNLDGLTAGLPDDEDDGEEIPVSDDDDEDEDSEDVPDEDDEDEDDEDEPPKTKMTKEQRRIVKLRQQLKAERDRNKQAQQQQTVNADRDALIAEYEENGFDRKVAERWADREIAAQQAQQKVNIMEFAMENSKVLDLYSAPSEDYAKIKNAMAATGMTAAQVCRGLYGEKTMTREQRAELAARGQLKGERTKDSVSGAVRSSDRGAQGKLSARDSYLKEQLERRYLDGEKISNDEYLSYKKQYNLK